MFSGPSVQVTCAGNPVNLDGYDFTMHGGMGLFLKPSTTSPSTQTCNIEDSIFAETNTSITEPLTERLYQRLHHRLRRRISFCL